MKKFLLTISIIFSALVAKAELISSDDINKVNAFVASLTGVLPFNVHTLEITHIEIGDDKLISQLSVNATFYEEDGKITPPMITNLNLEKNNDVRMDVEFSVKSLSQDMNAFVKLLKRVAKNIKKEGYYNVQVTAQNDNTTGDSIINVVIEPKSRKATFIKTLTLVGTYTKQTNMMNWSAEGTFNGTSKQFVDGQVYSTQLLSNVLRDEHIPTEEEVGKFVLDLMTKIENYLGKMGV